MPGYKRPPDGHVSLAVIAGELSVDRRVLKRLYDDAELAGVREAGVIWLDRLSLASYLQTRPRCIREDCDRRVIGPGPGCSRHRSDRRKHSEESRRKRRVLLRVVQWQWCERCGGPSRGRFCSHKCLRDVSLNRDPDRLQEGHREYRALVKRMKAERELIAIDEVLDQLERVGLPRTPGAITGYVRDGLLEPERGLGFAKPQLFTQASVDELVDRLRTYQDRRRRRFNDELWRGHWIRARHGLRHARRAWGRAEKSLAAAKGTVAGRPRGSGSVLTRDLRQRIDALRAQGRSNRAIAGEIHVSEATVRRYRPAS